MSEHESLASPNADHGDFAAATIDELAELFALLELPHALTGGHAVNQYTAPRLTYDLDFVVTPGKQGPARCRRLLEMVGYEVQREEGSDGDGGPAFVRLKHNGRGVMVDILEARTSFEQSLLQRAVRMDDLPFPVARPEDLIIGKLVSDRQRDQRDVLELAAVEGLDRGYIRDWAQRWHVMDVYERLLGSN
jgi:hypothetical protein